MASHILRLLRQIGVRGTLLGLAGLVFVHTLVGSLQSIQRDRHQLELIHAAAEWNEALQPLRDVTRLMALHRGLTSRVLNGDDSARPPRLEARTKIKALFASAKAMIPADSSTADALKRFERRWTEVQGMTDTPGLAPRDVFGAHTQLIARIQAAVRSEQSRDLNTLPLSVMLLSELQMDLGQAAEYTGQIRGLGAGYVTSGGANASVVGDVRVLSEFASALVSGIEENQAVAERDSLRKGVGDAVRALGTYTQHAGDVMAAPDSTTGGAYFDRGTQVIKGLSAANTTVREVLLEQLAAAADEAAAGVTRGIAAGVGVLVVVSAAVFAFGFYLFAELGAEPAVVRRMTDRIARGDLRAHETIRARQGIVVAVDQMREQLRTTLEMVQADAKSLARASADVASAAESIAEGAQSQAARVEHSRSALAEVQAAIRSNSGSAERTDSIAQETSRDAEQGETTVAEAVRSMRTISDSITVVKEIASRTNTLSLNAAIEASRAGRYGKGFAVVAHEIGKLAERSQKAALEINELAQGSVKTAEQVQGVFASIAPKVAETADRVGEIRSGSEHQSESTHEVASAMGELLSVAQSNSDEARRLAATSEDLLARSSSLNTRVESFRFA
ncbi:MAG: methyl-accepting chemotaxis protein [Pseudomonadota bacterium]